jgi:hypothetical protein
MPLPGFPAILALMRKIFHVSGAFWFGEDGNFSNDMAVFLFHVPAYSIKNGLFFVNSRKPDRKSKVLPRQFMILIQRNR